MMNAVPQPQEFREPWFRVVSVMDERGPSIADIVSDVCELHGVSMTEIRGERQTPRIRLARTAAYIAVRAQRSDLSSGRVARFFRRDGSTIRLIWRNSEAA